MSMANSTMSINVGAIDLEILLGLISIRYRNRVISKPKP